MTWTLQQAQLGSFPHFILQTLCFITELITATGLFLIPLTRWDLITRKQLLVTALGQAFFTILVFKSELTPLSAGVLFTGYFPRIIAVLFISFGVWGLNATNQIRHLISNEDRPLFLGSLLALLPITLFYSLMSAGDIKYSLPLTLPFIFFGKYIWKLNSITSKSPRFQIFRASYFVLLLCLSVFVNAYNLDTMEARWKIAKDLESAGMPAAEISAGYGRDLFTMGWTCAQKAIEKVNAVTDPAERARLMSDHVFKKIPRVYEDEWISRYIIKPAAIMGHPLALNQNIRPGQNSEPIQVMTYRSLGFQNQLAVFRAENSTPA